jgi:tetratricopeptide (TPR) repeat protein
MEKTLLGGRYQVLRRLGSGGFSRTFLVADLHLPNHPKCVIKQLKLQDKDTGTLEMARRLFDTEAQVLYRLGSHPQIPTLLAHFEEKREFYLAQEYIEGSRLNRQIEEGKPWSETRAILLLQEVLEILSFVHRQQVIHRDIKPSNLIRRHHDGKLVLIDFGAVKQVNSSPLVDAETGATNLTVAIGTHGYMPNEQYAGKPRFCSDVYAVGILGIRALTGLHPQKIGEDPVTGELDWHHLAPDVSSSLVAVLDRMVRYDYRDRYPSAQEALQALNNLPGSMGMTAGGDYFPAYAGGQTADHSIPADSTGGTAASSTADSDITMVAADQDPTSLIPENYYAQNGNGALAASAAAGNLDLKLNQESQTKENGILKNRSRLMSPLTIGGTLAIIGLAFSAWQTGLLAAFHQGANRPVTFSGLEPPALFTDLAILLPPEEKAAYWVSRGNRLMANQRFPEAQQLFDQAIRAKSDFAPAYLGRCKALNALKRPIEAIAACNDALAYQPYYPEAVRTKGNATEQQGRLLDALALYEETTAIMPAMFEGWLDRGRVLQRLGRSAESIQVIDQAIARNRNSAEAWTIRAEATWALERYEQTVIALEKALQVDSEYVPAKELRQRAREELGR